LKALNLDQALTIDLTKIPLKTAIMMVKETNELQSVKRNYKREMSLLEQTHVIVNKYQLQKLDSLGAENSNMRATITTLSENESNLTSQIDHSCHSLIKCVESGKRPPESSASNSTDLSVGHFYHDTTSVEHPLVRLVRDTNNNVMAKIKHFHVEQDQHRSEIHKLVSQMNHQNTTHKRQMTEYESQVTDCKRQLTDCKQQHHKMSCEKQLIINKQTHEIGTVTRTLKKTTQQLENLKNKSLCCVCLTNTSSHILKPCHHLGLCACCCQSIQRTTNRCPICRVTIESSHIVFM
jgi:hypothetical protein